MKVLLIVPTHSYKGKYPQLLSVSDFPSGMAYIASSLKEWGHEVYGLNLNNIAGYGSVEEMVEKNVEYALKSVKPDIVASGGLCIDYKFFKDVIRIIRANSKVKVVIGGNIVTNDGEFIFNTLKPDYAIEGDGEEVLVKLCDYLGGKCEIGSIPNLWYWGEDEQES